MSSDDNIIVSPAAVSYYQQQTYRIEVYTWFQLSWIINAVTACHMDAHFVYMHDSHSNLPNLKCHYIRV